MVHLAALFLKFTEQLNVKLHLKYDVIMQETKMLVYRKWIVCSTINIADLLILRFLIFLQKKT